MVRFLITTWLIGVCYVSSAQNINAFATAKSNRNTVFVEQALKVTVTVYTSTWFTDALQIENLQMEGAFVQSFKQTLSSIKYVDKKKYASLEFYYIIFPYKEGNLTFPALNIITQTPPEGDYKGKTITLKTKAINITVKPVPEEADEDRWLVASNVNIYNKWNTSLTSLKVGDVLIRTITTKATGTLPSFIDEPLVEDVEFGNIYTAEPQYIDERDSKSANGKRIDTYSYLLEKEGAFTIPALEVTWYNPFVGKFYKKQLPAYNINISKNTDMEALLNLKDSLNALNPVLINEAAMDQDTWNLKTILVYTIGLILILLIVLLCIRLCKRLFKLYKEKQRKFYLSEGYWFKKLQKQSSEKETLSALYQWLDYSKFKPKTNTLTQIKGDKTLLDNLETFKKNQFSSDAKQPIKLNSLFERLKHWRKLQLRKGNKKDINPLIDRLNP